jgi:hypothetical protein
MGLPTIEGRHDGSLSRWLAGPPNFLAELLSLIGEPGLRRCEPSLRQKILDMENWGLEIGRAN